MTLYLRIEALSEHFLRRSSLRHIVVGNFPLVPLPGHIEAAITAPKFLDVWNPVHTRTNDVLILSPVSGRQSARTAHVAVASFVLQKACKKTVHHVPVLVEIVALGFLELLQGLVKLLYLVHSRPSASLISFS